MSQPPSAGPLRSLTGPSALAPVQVDLRRVFLAGIGLWLVALAVTGALALAGRVGGAAVATSAAGALLGLWALAWERRRRTRG